MIKRRIILFGILAATYVAFTASVSGRSIAVFYALDQDEQAFRETVNCQPAVSICGSTAMYEYRWQDNQIFWVKMGSGCVQTAMSAQALFNYISPDLVFSIGPVGLINDAVDVPLGQWVVVSDVVAYQKGTIRDRQTGMGKKQQWHLENCTIPLPEIWKMLPEVSVASGELFIASADCRADLSQMTGADMVDMNLFGLLWVCDAWKLTDKSYHFRTISNKADKYAFNEFKAFIKEYDGEGGRLILETLKLQPQDLTDPSNYPAIGKLLSRDD